MDTGEPTYPFIVAFQLHGQYDGYVVWMDGR